MVKMVNLNLNRSYRMLSIGELSPSHTFTILARVKLRLTPIYQIVVHPHDS